MAERSQLTELRRRGPSYADDYAAWLGAQIDLLKAGRTDALDLEHLTDEVADLGVTDWKAYVSALRLVLLHMLKWDYQPGRRSRSWQATIGVQRDAVADSIRRSPSYGKRREEAVMLAYRDARREASGETDLRLGTFPDTCPYDWNAITTRPHVLPGEDA